MGLLIILRYRQGLELSEKCQTVEDSIDLLTKCPNDVSFFDRRIFHHNSLKKDLSDCHDWNMVR